MNGSILGLGTQSPDHVITQQQALDRVLNVFQIQESQKQTVKKLYENSGIKKRHVIDSDFLTKDFSQSPPGMSERNEIYKKNAHLLAEKSARKALEMWGGDLSEITHVISVSCTGVFIPGIEFLLIDLLGLKRSIFRLGVNFMGCFGAFKGLHVASAFAKENTNARILMVCTELCSLHIQDDKQPDSLVSNSLFADGSAAVVVGSGLRGSEKSLFEMKEHYSMGLEKSLEQMSWEASDSGFLMKLSTYVPMSIAHHIEKFVKSMNTAYSEFNFAIHPGGKSILQVIEKKLKLARGQTQSSWDVLENYGNMSSATFLFVLQQMLQRGFNSNKDILGLGFGPGLSIEGIHLIAQ